METLSFSNSAFQKPINLSTGLHSAIICTLFPEKNIMMKRSREDDDTEVGSQSNRGWGGGGGGRTASSTSETALDYIKSIKLVVQSDLYAKFQVLLMDFKARRIDVASVRLQIKKLFAGYPDLILGFNLFLPEEYKISLDDEDNDDHDENTDTEPETEEEEEEQEKEEDKDGKFVEALHHHHQPRCNGNGSDTEIKTILHKQGLNLCDKIVQVLCVSDYQDLLKNLYDYSNEKITRDDLVAAVNALLGSDQNRNLVKEFDDFIKAPDEHLSKLWKSEVEEKKDQKQRKPVHELDLSKCKEVTPSYRLLPKAYRVNVSSSSSSRQRLENGDVLNNKFVCVDAKRGDYSFKHRQIQQGEEIMFKCEDDRYEMDMLMESVRSATEKVKKLLSGIKEKKIYVENGFKIEENLSVLNRRCIERLYGDYGLEMMDVLKEKPMKALPVILNRLEQKQQELTEYKQEFNKVCTQIYSKMQRQEKSRREHYSLEECCNEEKNGINAMQFSQ